MNYYPHSNYINYLIVCLNDYDDLKEILERKLLISPSLDEYNERLKYLKKGWNKTANSFIKNKTFKDIGLLFNWAKEKKIDLFLSTMSILQDFPIVKTYPLDTLNLCSDISNTPSVNSKIHALKMAGYENNQISKIIRETTGFYLTPYHIKIYCRMYFNLVGVTEIDLIEYLGEQDDKKIRKLYKIALEGPRTYLEMTIGLKSMPRSEVIKLMSDVTTTEFIEESRSSNTSIAKLEKLAQLYCGIEMSAEKLGIMTDKEEHPLENFVPALKKAEDNFITLDQLKEKHNVKDLALVTENNNESGN